MRQERFAEFPLIRLCTVDLNRIGGGVINHPEVHRFADVPEPDIIVAEAVMDTR